MVIQYPHTIIITVTGTSGRDGNGDWLDATATTTTLKGRYETNTGNVIIGVADGKGIVYKGIVYLPLPVSDIAIGSEVQVMDESGSSVAKGEVKNFSRGQLNARIWL